MLALLEKLKSLDLTLILAVLLGLSETLALIPSLKSNSVLQLLLNGLKKLKELLSKKS